MSEPAAASPAMSLGVKRRPRRGMDTPAVRIALQAFFVMAFLGILHVCLQ